MVALPGPWLVQPRPLGNFEWTKIGGGLPDAETRNENRWPTVAAAFDGLVNLGARGAGPGGGVVVVARVPGGAGPPPPVVDPYCQQAQAMVPFRATPACMVAIGKARAPGQTVALDWLAYSTLRTGLPARANGSRAEHSPYSQHCSFTVPSARGSMSAMRLSPLMPFFRNHAIPSPWTAPAISAMNVISLAMVKGKPVLSV